jgi:hypothetical protein
LVNKNKALRLKKSERRSRIIKKERPILFLLMLARNLGEEILPISRPSREDLRQKSWRRKSSIWML